MSTFIEEFEDAIPDSSFTMTLERGVNGLRFFIFEKKTEQGLKFWLKKEDISKLAELLTAWRE